MKRLLLFLLFATLGTSALVYIAGGIHGRPQIEREAKLPVSPHAPGSRPSIETPDGQLDIESARNITQMAPPMRLVWKDRLSDETITIDNFQRWRCTARSVNPLPLAATGGQGALLGDVLFETYRDPETRAEAMALRDTTGEERYATLLHQRLRAGEARVTGKLGEAMAARRSGNAADRSLGDTALELSQDIVLEDKGQNLVIRGGEGASLTVYPEQDRARGKGPFSLEHDAVHMTGNGLVLDRNLERHYIRVEITRDPRLRIQKASKGEGGKPLFDFGEGDFQPTTVTSAGRAILEREMLRRETVMTVTFHDRVYAAQLGGRTLNAGRANLVAFTSTLPTAKSSDWKLRRFHADRHVTIHYPGRTKKDEAFLATVDAERLRYDIPEDGSEPTTVLEEDVDIRMRGEIAMLGTGGMLRATCRERAWIGPLPDGAPDGGIDRLLLRQISLRGAARLERVTTAQESTGDLIAAEAIDVIAWPRGSNAAGDDEPQAPLAPGESTRMTAVHFAAVGDVHLAGAQIRGETARIVADDLHTETPRVFAEGEGTRFTFRQLASNQGLLGPSAGTGNSTAGNTGRSADDDKDGRWMLDRIVARGAVDIDTTLGGPALGIPAHLQGDEITYDGLSRIARIRSLGGEPVRIGWTAAGTKTNQIETRTLTLDRAAGRITAEGGVEGELYLARRGGGSGFGMPGMSAGVGPSLDGAE
ncbi:MAG: hypothetical protein P1V36_16615, partial [Planctomycetota bacterium]|nr:hypothetical protein [Planctomycetota bacterium]